MSAIQKLTAESAAPVLPQLIALLQDAVGHGASVGFITPLSGEVAGRYWQDVIREVAQGARVLLVAEREGVVAGTVQLGLCLRPNGLHRAEVQKLLVHTRWRRQGLARALMQAAEDEARQAGQSLLYLDTGPHQPAAALYEQMGWTLAGEIPGYAATPDGELHSTTFYYRNI